MVVHVRAVTGGEKPCNRASPVNCWGAGTDAQFVLVVCGEEHRRLGKPAGGFSRIFHSGRIIVLIDVLLPLVISLWRHLGVDQALESLRCVVSHRRRLHPAMNGVYSCNSEQYVHVLQNNI